MIRILSIDGGGIRGIIPATILVAFESYLKQYSGNSETTIADYVDLIAGTSTGGILTALYICPDPKNPTKSRFSAQEALDFYLQHGPTIFKKNFLHSLYAVFGLAEARYKNKSYLALLEDILGKTKLSELIRPCLICAYDIERRQAVLFNQLDPYRSNTELDFYVKDVLQATSAAPTYFQPARIQDSQGESYSLIDGGVFANNPTLCAYAEASKLSKERGNNYSIFSLGTGAILQPYPYCKAKGWGGAGWARPLFSILLGGVAETVDYQVKVMYEAEGNVKDYLRIQTFLSESEKELAQLDNVSEKN
ncbi:MAG: patatin-like phospholipase family protein, partial [Niameybacter sp.]